MAPRFLSGRRRKKQDSGRGLSVADFYREIDRPILEVWCQYAGPLIGTARGQRKCPDTAGLSAASVPAGTSRTRGTSAALFPAWPFPQEVGSMHTSPPINMENSRLKKRVMIFDHPFFPFVHSPAAHRRYPSFPVPQEKTPAGISRIMPLYNSVGRIIHHFWLQKNDNVHILRLTQIKKSAVRSEIPQRTKNVFSVQLVASASTQRTVI